MLPPLMLPPFVFLPFPVPPFLRPLVLPAIHVPDAAVLPPNAVVDSADRSHTHSRNLSLSH